MASNTVLRIVNQKTEPEASAHIVHALFFSSNDQVLTDVLGDQVNGVSVVHKILQSPFVDPAQKPSLLEVTKHVLIELKVTSSQAYRRLIEEVGLPVPNFGGGYGGGGMAGKKTMLSSNNAGSPAGYQAEQQSLASMMAALQMQSVGLPLNSSVMAPGLPINQGYQHNLNVHGNGTMHGLQTPQSSVGSNSDSLNNYVGSGNSKMGGRGVMGSNGMQNAQGNAVASAAHSANRTGMGMMGMGGQSQSQFGLPSAQLHPQAYQQYVYQLYQQQQQQPNVGAFHA